MRPDETPFKTGWYGSRLEGYRDEPDLSYTYSGYRYESLPPVPKEQFHGRFQWLTESSKPLILRDSRRYESDIRHERAWVHYLERFEQESPAGLVHLRESALRKGIVIPEDFYTLFSSVKVIGQIKSCTDCFFSVSDLIFHENPDFGCMIRFYEDSQTCLLWYLYILPSGDHCIVVSPRYFSDSWYLPAVNFFGDEEGEEILFCAESLEEFIYRIWIENQIWYHLSWLRLPLTETQRAYAEHYKQPKPLRP
jgi:hypothetical protein